MFPNRRSQVKRYVCLIALVTTTMLLLLLTSCAQAPQATDPVSVTKALFTAINQGKADVAAGYFAEDAELVTGFGQPTGLTKIRDFMKLTVVPMKTRVEVKEVTADGTAVTGVFTMKNNTDVYRNATPMQVIGVVQNGKITSMTWTPVK
jgi:ketosteroid isomerase-like protein